MSKLERYLEFNWTALSSRVDGSTEDKAIHVMRKLDEDLGAKDYELGQMADVNKELIAALKRCEEMVSTDNGPPNWDWIREVIAKANGEPGK